MERLNKIQQALVGDVQTYFSAVDSEIANANAEITAQEQALGKALGRIEQRAVGVASNVGRAFFIAASGGFLGGGNTGTTATGSGGGRKRHASGALFNTQGTTDLGTYGMAGEAGSETVAILRNPRPFLLGGGGGGNTVNFYGDITVRTEADIDQIARKVTKSMGNTAALKGLRSPN